MKVITMKTPKTKIPFPALRDSKTSERSVRRGQQRFLNELWQSHSQTSPRAFGNLCFRPKGSKQMNDVFVPKRFFKEPAKEKILFNILILLI